VKELEQNGWDASPSGALQEVAGPCVDSCDDSGGANLRKQVVHQPASLQALPPIALERVAERRISVRHEGTVDCLEALCRDLFSDFGGDLRWGKAKEHRLDPEPLPGLPCDRQQMDDVIGVVADAEELAHLSALRPSGSTCAS